MGASFRRAPKCATCGSRSEFAGTSLLGLALVFLLLSALSLAFMDVTLLIAMLLGLFGMMRCIKQYYAFRKSKGIVA
jgi:hypothetical protein